MNYDDWKLSNPIDDGTGSDMVSNCCGADIVEGDRSNCCGAMRYVARMGYAEYTTVRSKFKMKNPN